MIAWVARDYHDAEASCRPQCNEIRSELKLHADIAYALFAIGGAMAATGMVLWIGERRGHKTVERRAYVAPAPGILVLGGQF